MKFPLKPMSKSGIPAALLKAERYRLLNDPEAAESICLDILAADPKSQAALKALLLTLSDQFARKHSVSHANEARECASQLESEYERAYYTGVVFEREARALIARSMLARRNAYGVFRQAMEWYEKAESLRTPGNDDAILRWNSCARTIERENLQPEEPERDLPLE